MKQEELFQTTIRKLRDDRNLSQQQVADLLGISKVGYQNYEVGRRKPTFEMLIALADFFGVSLDYLVGRTDKPEINR